LGLPRGASSSCSSGHRSSSGCRALRKSKTGKFSWIVDIEDVEDEMLHKQYRERRIKYKKVLGLDNKDEVFENLNPKLLEDIFIQWEEL
jgi:hypothetical protein